MQSARGGGSYIYIYIYMYIYIYTYIFLLLYVYIYLYIYIYIYIYIYVLFEGGEERVPRDPTVLAPRGRHKRFDPVCPPGLGERI